MSLYFDCTVETPYKSAINTHLAWHPQASCLAVASYSEEKGGTVIVSTGEGKLCDDVDIPPHATAQVTMLSWHPIKRILAIGWESGELFLWNDHEHELHEIQSLHRAPISVLNFSSGGKRLISGDTSGSLFGWNSDSHGNMQTAFSHELKDPLVQIVFRVSASDNRGGPNFDINNLAKAAVSGDEQALDIFSSWRPKTGHKRMVIQPDSKDNANFFLGSSTGIVYHINEHGHCVEVLQAEGGVKSLLHHSSRNLLVVISENLVLGQFSVGIDGAVSEITKVKLSGRTSDIHVSWAGVGLLVVSTGDAFLRLWNLDSGDNYVLDLVEAAGYRAQELILCLSYSPAKKILCAGTNMGNIAMWKYEEHTLGLSEYSKDPEKDWTLQAPIPLIGAVTQIAWGSSLQLLGVNTVRSVYILSEQRMVTSFRDQVCVVQTTPTQLSVDVFSAGTRVDLKADIQVRGVHNSVDHIILWNLKKLFVYELNSDSSYFRVVDSFPCENEKAVVHEGSVYTLEGEAINVRSLQGAVKQKLKFTDAEGEGVDLDVCGNYLVAASITGVVKLYDLSRREAKVHSQGKMIPDVVKDFGEIISARCNCTGTRVSLALATQPSLMPDSKLYIWDVENDLVTYFNFATGKPEDEDSDGPGSAHQPHSSNSNELTHQDRAKQQMAKEIRGRFVINHSWDAEDPRLLVCEAKSLLPKDRGGTLGKDKSPRQSPLMVVSLFVSLDHGMILQESFHLLPDFNRFLGVQAPFFCLLNNEAQNMNSRGVTQKVMRDFHGLENADKPTREAMLNFSFYLSIGNMDEAFKSIKAIKSETVWENMSKMCVKTKRLDVAALCLGNMGHARGARALRIASQESQLDAKVAMLALQLGMIEEAERLYRGCGRSDLINQMYQDAGIWSKALEAAEKEDRIHLRSTHYNYARHLENKGDFSGAITHYEKSDTYRFEVPRMLFDELPTLEDYIMHTNDKGLRRWWAQYLESTGEMETALQFYEAADDYLSLVRVNCYCNNLDKAADIANETGDRAACYHLARQYENVDQVKEAIHFFSRAQAYGNAIRICKENAFDDQLMNLALVAGPQEQIDAARYFTTSDRPQINRAVMLYHKAGLLSKAVDMAFKSGQVSAIAQIAMELDEKADPAVIQRCSEYFISISQFDKAVNLLILGGQYITALNLSVEHNVMVTEDLAEKLTLPKDESARNEILEKVAESAYAQGNYKLATKKFTQAGNKVKAMKCLLKSGDTERIVYFANVCRQSEIYIMAANYLQSLDWRKNPEIMQNIVQFYTRAKANNLLVEFYDSCAQIEIDDYQNYEKAAGALREAYKYASESPDTIEGKKEEIQIKMTNVMKYLEIKRLLDHDADTALQELSKLLQDQSIESSVRQGDVFATLIEYFAANGNFKSALGTLQEMRLRLPKKNPRYYIDSQVLEAITKATGVAFQGTAKDDLENGASDEEEDEEIIEEQEEDLKRGPPLRRPLFNGAAHFL